jgi:UDP-N-acetylglucosamine 2-epimerase
MPGNTIVDTLQANMEIANNKISYSERLSFLPKSYFVLIFHKPENVGNIQKL